MKVYVLPADKQGCGHYRLVWPAYVLRRDLGWDIEILPPGSSAEDRRGFRAIMRETSPGKKEIVSLSVPKDADLLVVQRPAHEYQPNMIDVLRQSGIAVLVDMDDDMTHIHPKNIAYHTYSPRSDTQFSWKYAAQSCAKATFVTTSTANLQRVYAPPGRGAVLDNYVPGVTLNYPKPETGQFGWAGTTASHPDDLTVCGASVQRLLDEGHQFTVIGPSMIKRRTGPAIKSSVKEQLRLREEPPHTGDIGLDKWIKTIGETLDVGMVPLAPNAFNSSKSRLKGIECMAAGVPWVASPRTEYLRLHRESGCGLLAPDPRAWYTSLKRLLTDEPFRKEQVEMGREYMRTQTYEAQAWRWAEAWETAYKIQKGLA